MQTVQSDSIKIPQSLLDMDATRMAKQIASGQLSSVEATKAYMAHLNHINPNINCVVEDRFSEALKEAAFADQQLKAGEAKGRLFGVPFSMKESFHVEGMKITGGLVHRNEIIANEDADVVAMLKAEGAIIIGKTNTPALCFCQESDNKLYGRTNNPWNIDKTAGGSSGGEGALMAVGGAAAGIGADIGGSIRFPSHFNGVIGFKSGNGQVSQKGSFPFITHPLQERMLGIGPMVKSVSDARLIYHIIAKNPVPSVELKQYTIDILPTTDFPIESETEAVLDEMKSKLRSEHKVESNVPPYFNESALIWQEIMSVDGGKATADIAFSNKKSNPLKEFVREKTVGTSKYHYYLTWALIGARMFKPSKKRVNEIEETLKRGDQHLEEYLESRILILPVYHRTAPEHGKLYSELFSIKKTFKKYMPYVAYANVWGLPSLTIPGGVDEAGMPIGVQLISKNGNEEALFQLGELIEREFGGYKRCAMHDEKD